MNQLIHPILNIFIWILLLVELSGTIPLVNSEFVEGNICPKL